MRFLVFIIEVGKTGVLGADREGEGPYFELLGRVAGRVG
jgi:hypothetical protein